jgi:hypothetical protein
VKLDPVGVLRKNDGPIVRKRNAVDENGFDDGPGGKDIRRENVRSRDSNHTCPECAAHRFDRSPRENDMASPAILSS